MSKLKKGGEKKIDSNTCDCHRIELPTITHKEKNLKIANPICDQK